MLRKMILAAAATAALGVAALAPTAASAYWVGPAGYWGYHPYAYGYVNPYVTPYVADHGSCYVVRRLEPTDFGPQVRRVTICD